MVVLGLLLGAAPRAALGVEADGQWARVLEVLAPHMLRVEDDQGEVYVVWHIGLIGAPPAEGDTRAFDKGTQTHSALLPPGSRVWLEAEPGLTDLDPGLRLRHVFLAGDRESPLGARLLRAGWVRTYPVALHGYAEPYAEAQADAVLAGAGAWGETETNVLFLPDSTFVGGLPTTRRMLSALATLDSDPAGHSVLVDVNRFPVEVGVERTPSFILAYFAPRLYTVKLSSNVMGAEPQTIAAVLLHELTHVEQTIDANLARRDKDCYASELEAATAAARYWESVHGPTGKPRLTHPVDAALNQLLADYRDGALPSKLQSTYRDQCEDQDASLVLAESPAALGCLPQRVGDKTTLAGVAPRDPAAAC
jgi:hypothetical protein